MGDFRYFSQERISSGQEHETNAQINLLELPVSVCMYVCMNVCEFRVNGSVCMHACMCECKDKT